MRHLVAPRAIKFHHAEDHYASEGIIQRAHLRDVLFARGFFKAVQATLCSRG